MRRQELDINKIHSKLTKMVLPRYKHFMFQEIADLTTKVAFTEDPYRSPPKELDYKPVPKGFKWGKSGLTAWFQGKAVMPPIENNKKIYMQAKTGGVETLLFIQRVPVGVFDKNHHTVLLFNEGERIKAREFEFALEAYAGHDRSCNHLDTTLDDSHIVGIDLCYFESIKLVIKNEIVCQFIFDLSTISQLFETLNASNFFRKRIANVLVDIYKLIDAMPEEKEGAEWVEKLNIACSLIEPVLKSKNTGNSPQIALTGHSHLDTAWLWTVDETKRKCARTFSIALNLMREYPEYRFLQSAPYHLELIKNEYPQIFEKIKLRVSEGKWEPNGGMYVESDCNIPFGEALIRNFLFGIQSTRNNFGYSPDTLWLPDVFGYSASLPQILRGCNINYFCTTKLSWNDTTKFPYTSFVWRGIDGSSVISHFNTIHVFPDIKTITKQWDECSSQKEVESCLCAYGYGDGGGGPHFEMIESARRIEDLEGCPRTKHMSVSDFMEDIGKRNLPEWFGELYLELHRGTYTSLGRLKRYNRKVEFALRDAEILASMALLRGKKYPTEVLKDCWEKLLVNQFHDIVPGTAIEAVNVSAENVYAEVLAKAEDLKTEIVSSLTFDNTDSVTIVNTLSWPRSRRIIIPAVAGLQFGGNDVITQAYKDIDGNAFWHVSGISIPGMGSKSFILTRNRPKAKSSFNYSSNILETPLATVSFNEAGQITSFIIKSNGREIVKPNGFLNIFYAGDDTPLVWDNWDIDSDQYIKMSPENNLISRDVISDGPNQIRIRSKYKIRTRSTLIQDMVFFSDSLQIDFETKVDWQEKHCLLKVGFNLDLLINKAKCEIQYGYIERSTYHNRIHEQAQFEVCAHKWVDVSEHNFGVALLNDCKYGLGLNDGSIYLSLLKSGTHPDPRADNGIHYFNYSILPHFGAFDAPNVIHPAYEFNVPVISCIGEAKYEHNCVAAVDDPSVIIEVVKQSEDANSVVLRLYESTKARRKVRVSLPQKIKNVFEANMLEEIKHELLIEKGTIQLEFKPFEIKTLICLYE